MSFRGRNTAGHQTGMRNTAPPTINRIREKGNEAGCTSPILHAYTSHLRASAHAPLSAIATGNSLPMVSNMYTQMPATSTQVSPEDVTETSTHRP
jgi:hypothetical protein